MKERPAFDFGSRPSTHDPERGKEALQELKKLFSEHPSEELLKAFAKTDPKIGLLGMASIERHLKECKECLTVVEAARK